MAWVAVREWRWGPKNGYHGLKKVVGSWEHRAISVDVLAGPRAMGLPEYCRMGDLRRDFEMRLQPRPPKEERTHRNR